MNEFESHVAPLNRLLKGELSAIHTYKQVLAKVKDDPRSEELKKIESDHWNAVDCLRQRVIALGGHPTPGAGAWGAFAEAVTATAKMLGTTVALKALKEGEEHGMKDYEDAMQDAELEPEFKTLISQELIPRQIEHIRVLDDLMSA